MANVVVVGAQWGDEGKGKIVDWLSEQADIVVRFQGGHNAGHTLVVDGQTYKLSLLPSGVLRAGKLSVIGNGVVLDPQALLDELARLATQGVKVEPEDLRIAGATDDYLFEGEVAIVESLGEVTLLYIEGLVPNEPIIVKLPGTHDVTRGQKMHFSAERSKLHLFDADGRTYRK